MIPSSPKTKDRVPRPASQEFTNPSVDVFHYLDTWDSRAGSRLSIAEDNAENPAASLNVEPNAESETDAIPAPRTVAEDVQNVNPDVDLEDITQNTPGSFHSDSAIFVEDSSAEESPLYTRAGSIDFESIGVDGDHLGGSLSPVSISLREAESFYRNEALRLPRQHQPRPPIEKSVKTRPYPRPDFSQSERPPIDPSSEGPSPKTPPPPPLYRTFHKLNYRVLSSLQEDIVQLEALLAELEANGRHFPPLEQHRHEIMEQIQRKLEQYNKLLCSSQQVQRSFTPATVDQIEAYRDGLRSKTAPHSPLEHYHMSNQADDLVIFPDRFPSTDNIASIVRLTWTLSILAVILPLFAISMIHSYLARFSLLSIITTLLSIAWQTFDLNSNLGVGERESKGYLLGYVGLMTGAALLF